MESVCSLALYVFGTIADFRFRSGLRQKRPYVCHPITLASASVPSIIEYHKLYDYPRYRTLLQHRANTLGLLFSIQGHRKTGCPCFPLFYPRSAQQPISPIPLYPSRIFYSAHQRGSQQPNERRELTRCIEKMLNDPREESIYVIADALDECPDISGLQSSREKVLGPIEELVGFHLYVSASQVALRSTSEMFSNQRRDDVDIKLNMLGWKVKDKMLVIKTPTVRADGM